MNPKTLIISALVVVAIVLISVMKYAAFADMPAPIPTGSVHNGTVRSIRTTPSGVEIEVTSNKEFSVRNELAVLHIGAQEFTVSRYPESGDTHTLIFTLPEDEFAKTATGDPVTVQYGRGENPGERWDFGPLDKSLLKSTSPSSSTPSAASRSFYMGFTPSEYDLTPAALEETYQFIQTNAELIVHHRAEGVPWPEALAKKPYHPNVEKDLQLRVQKRNPNQKVFLYLNPLAVTADGLANYWGETSNMERPGKWKDKDFDDPEVRTAYLNFCRDLIQRLRPDFMGYGIEVNGLLKNKPQQWPKFVQFAKQVYTTLKAENPNLPIFVSIQIDTVWEDKNNEKAISDILPYTDYLAVSTYPYFSGYDDPRKLPRNYFSRIAALAPGKPFAVAETGFIAEDMQAFGVKAHGREERQNQYMQFLLEESNRLNAKFVVWFVPRDYDPFFEKVKSSGASAEVLALFKIWKDTGLVDGKEKGRAGLETWKQWLALPRK